MLTGSETPGSPSVAGSAAAPALAPLPPAPKAARWRLSRTPLKIALGAFALLAGTYGILSEQNFVASSNAVVSAYVVSVRTPIDGTVYGLPSVASARLHAGDALGSVENLRVDRQALETPRVIEERAQSEVDALLQEKAILETQRRQFLYRANAHAKAVTARLQLQALSDERLLLAKQAALRQATFDLDRGRHLHADGIIAKAEFEKLQTQFEIADKEADAQQAALSATRAEAESAIKGVYIEPGDHGIDYSRQRSDEINLRLADIDHDLAALKSQARAAHDDLDSETRHSNLMSHADLAAPVSGMLWKLEAINGERVSTGDAIAEFVDCQQSFVLAEVPQDRLSEIALGAPAHIKLSGEDFERTGTIRWLSADPQKEDDGKLAAVPLKELSDQLATAYIQFNSNEIRGDCVVGRAARVLLPTNGSNAISRWLRQSF
jgi:multidrug resistance efflux pump